MMYVATANSISLLTQMVLNLKSVKKVLSIPILTEYDELRIKEAQKKQKNLIEGFKQGYKDKLMLQEIKEREKLMERKFQQAGTNAPVRTFSQNPLNKKKQ